MGLKGLKRVQDAIEALEHNVNDKIRAVWLQGLGNIITNAPVDEGRFKNNFFVDVGKPNPGIRYQTDESGSASTASLYSGMPEYVIGKTIYMTNNLPYAEWLEYGSQQHKGQIRIEIQRMQRAVKKL